MHICLGVMGMIRFAICSTLLLLASSASAESATQTDWSGGPGVWGPVTGFGDDFYSDSGIECHPTGGGIRIDLVDQLIGHLVVEDYVLVSSVRAADIDLDGDMDLVSAGYGEDELSWWENMDGAGDEWEKHIIDPDYHHSESIWPVDVDSDGLVDVVACAPMDEEYGVAWWRNRAGLPWVRHVIAFGGEFGGYEVHASDVDGDGSMDVISASLGEGIWWWDNADGSGLTWTAHVVYDGGPFCVHSADVDGDGDLDIIGYESGMKVSWWENLDGAGITWSLHRVDDDFPSARSVFAGDIDSDGDIDLAGASFATGSLQDISWWENLDGAGLTWLQHVVDSAQWGARAIWIADLDEDGDGDLVGASYYEGDVAWWENLDGSGESWEKHLAYGGFAGASSVCVADIDTDGILDVAATGREENRIVWWDVLTYPPEGWLASSVLDVSCWPDWGTLDWTAHVPPGTSVAFQVRSSSSPDSASFGPWSDTLYTPCSLQGILPDGQRYFQYKAILQRVVHEATPRLQSVTVTWEPMVGLEDHEASIFTGLLPVTPNPVTGLLTVSFVVPEPASVEISLYDLSGRLVHTDGPREYLPGTSSVELDDPGPGIYFVRMRTAGFEEVQRFAVVE